MDDKNMGWKIATGILAVVIVVLLGLMWSDWNEERYELGNVLERGQENLTDIRGEVSASCRGPGANEADCQDALEELADILQEFKEDLEKANAGTGTPEAQ